MKQKQKIYIDIWDDINPEMALSLIASVIADGKISTGEHGKKYYCWGTLFSTPDGQIMISTRQYRKNDCFVVHRYVKKDGTEVKN